jgi:hypothetical protein
MRTTLLCLLSIITVSAFAQPEIDAVTRRSYRKECQEVAKYAASDLNIQCNYNYHHFNSDAYKKYYNRNKTISSGKVRIAGWNVLHPGMDKTRYKDYAMVAKIINRWDVVGMTELIPLVSHDQKHNENILNFIADGPKNIKWLEDKIASESRRRSSKKLPQFIKRLEVLKEDLKVAPTLYRDPGYLKILRELHKLPNGKEWALILSPRGEAAKETDVQELVGYYYRSSVVKPKVNQYCKQIRTLGKGSPYACIPNMGKLLLGENKQQVFSRRPFMSEFISGRFSFILLATHVVFNSPLDEEGMARVLEPSFGVRNYVELGTGANKLNYARFAETKVILEFMHKLKERFRQKDIILVGDFNLEYHNKFWSEVLPTMPGVQLFIDQKSSISEARYDNDMNETGGVASDYDHFIFDPEETDECDSSTAQVESFYSGDLARLIHDKYLVRKENSGSKTYAVNRAKYKALVKEFVTPLRQGKNLPLTINFKRLTVNGKKIRVRGVTEDNKKVEKYVDFFNERVLDSQLKDDTYYTMYTEVLSDHKPVSMECYNR